MRCSRQHVSEHDVFDEPIAARIERREMIRSVCDATSPKPNQASGAVEM